MGLPGDYKKTDENERCQHENCAAMAAWKVQGETDSMGCEYLYYCDIHFDVIRKGLKNPMEDICDLCGTFSIPTAARLPDEGINGPVYLLCAGCIRQQKEFEE